MNSDKKMYLYSGLAIVGALVAYVIITKKKPSPTDSEGTGTTDTETTVAVSTTGEVIDQSQVIIPVDLANILKKTSAQATALLINKPIYSKLDNVKVRMDNFVNNGVVNNIMSTINNKGTLLGNVIQVVDDKGKLTNPEGKIYKWFKIKPSQVALDDMNKNRDFLTRLFLPSTTGGVFYVREDTVRLDK
jgi:hypothetical protein